MQFQASTRPGLQEVLTGGTWGGQGLAFKGSVIMVRIIHTFIVDIYIYISTYLIVMIFLAKRLQLGLSGGSGERESTLKIDPERKP